MKIVITDEATLATLLKASETLNQINIQIRQLNTDLEAAGIWSLQLYEVQFDSFDRRYEQVNGVWMASDQDC